ncbi:transcriptional regulator [Deinococcus cavernae]|uniref:Transcriptional regulator n=1 Tax=Deinococcus cavernae TaxID=2320857 RepID=A0A418VEH1_9DEIO|nr:metalloregulator ArsR/SmtB family transcription factor [Deinococcus cavernae]RJF74504.1 transcriptional regulator [Deinococcus cavernae]
MDIDASAELFKALSDPGRLKVLRLLAHPPVNGCSTPGSVCACDLEEHLGLAQPTISHHMRLLVQAGLVRATKRGRWMDYTLNPQGFEAAQVFLRTLSHPGARDTATQPQQHAEPL